MNDPQLQDAVRTVVRNCGLSAAASRRLQAHPNLAAKIRSLARTAPEYQRHVVERLLSGDQNPFRPIASTLLAYDTVGLHEVTSRLHRAVGMVRLEAEYLDRHCSRGFPPNRLSDRLLTLDLIAEQARALGALLDAIDVRPGSFARKPPRRTLSAPANEVKDKLHAPSALGLIAKNVRNVAVLQQAHLPTVAEKEIALALTAQARQLAVAARDAAGRAFGRADHEQRVCSRGRTVRRVISHCEPDGDALVSAWLTERFLFANESVEVLFVPRERVLGAYRRGDCLVDVGNTHDPVHLSFDHKPPALPDRHDSCAAKLIWEYLRSEGHAVGHLQLLIFAVYAGDSAKQRMRYGYEYKWSTTAGFHAFLARARSRKATDAAVYRAARRWLDQTYQPW